MNHKNDLSPLELNPLINLGRYCDVKLLAKRANRPLDHFMLRTNSFALNPEGNWYGLVRTDAAAFHAFLSNIATFYGIQCNHADEKSIAQYHRSEAVRLINSRLDSELTQLPDMLVVAVAILVVAEACNPCNTPFELYIIDISNHENGRL